MKTLLLAVAVAVAVATSNGAAQARPDFSGRWTVEQPAAGEPANMGSGWGTPITLTQDARQLTLEYAFFTRGDMQPPLKFVYALDGSETRNSVMMGRGIQVQRSKAAWDGQTLVITTVHPFIDPATGKSASVDVVQKISLAHPDTLIVETTRGPVLGGPPSTTRVTYRRN